jgi:hypothetical protein
MTCLLDTMVLASRCSSAEQASAAMQYAIKPAINQPALSKHAVPAGKGSFEQAPLSRHAV